MNQIIGAINLYLISSMHLFCYEKDLNCTCKYLVGRFHFYNASLVETDLMYECDIIWQIDLVSE